MIETLRRLPPIAVMKFLGSCALERLMQTNVMTGQTEDALTFQRLSITTVEAPCETEAELA